MFEQPDRELSSMIDLFFKYHIRQFTQTNFFKSLKSGKFL